MFQRPAFWTRQPKYALRLDRRSVFCENLVFHSSGVYPLGLELAQGRYATKNSGAKGVAHGLSGSHLVPASRNGEYVLTAPTGFADGFNWGTSTDYILTGNWTIAWRGQITEGQSSSTNYHFNRWSSTVANRWSFTTIGTGDATNQGKLRFTVTDSAGVGVSIMSTTAMANSRRVRTFLVTYDGTTVYFYIDGTLQGSAASAAMASSADNLWFGTDNFGRDAVVTASILHMTSKYWSEALVKEFCRNPWQIYKKGNRQEIYAVSGAAEFSGSGAITLPAPTIAGTGSHTHAVGSGAITIPAPTVAGSGQLTISGSGAMSIPAPVVAGTGAVGVTGSGAIVLPNVAVAGIGTFGAQETINGIGAIVLPNVVVSGVGNVGVRGSGVMTLPNVVVAGVGIAHPASLGSNIAIPVPIVSGSASFTAPPYAIVQPDRIRIDPRIPSENEAYERRWLMDNMKEARQKLQQTKRILAAGGVGNTLGAYTIEQILYSFVFPASSFVQVGQTLILEARGTTANNANNKTLRARWGSQVAVAIGPLTGANGYWSFEVIIQFLTANTQKIITFNRLTGAITEVAGTQDTTTEITLALTGQTSVATAGDATLVFAELSHYNAN